MQGSKTVTLATVVAAHQRLHTPPANLDCCESCKLIALLEADPDFTLADRLRSLADSVGSVADPDDTPVHRPWLNRRLADLLEGKP